MFRMSDQEEPTKEEKILDAAMEEFTEKGWGGARMQSIADRAEINKPLLHYYFRSKENLYTRIMEKVLDFFFSTVARLDTEQESFEDFLRDLIALLVEGASRNPRLPLFLMQELSRKGKTVRLLLRKALQEENFAPARIVKRVQKEIASGRVREISPVQFMLTLVGACLYHAMAEPVMMEILESGLVSAQPFDRKAFIEERKEAVFQMLYHGMKKDLEKKEG